MRYPLKRGAVLPPLLVVLIAVILSVISPIPTVKAEATMNADNLSQPVYIAFVKVSPDGSRTAFHTVWVPLTATGVWQGAGITINVDTATYTADACGGSGTAVVDTYDNVKVFTLCEVPEGTIPSPTDQLTISWTIDGSNVSSTLNIAFWWWLDPEGQTPTPSGEYWFDFANYGYNDDGIGIVQLQNGGVPDILFYLTANSVAYGDTIYYYPYGPVVFAFGQGKIRLYFPNGLEETEAEITLPQLANIDVAWVGWRMQTGWMDANGILPETLPTLAYATAHIKFADPQNEPTAIQIDYTYGSASDGNYYLSLLHFLSDGNDYESADVNLTLAEQLVHAAWLYKDVLSTTPPWNVTVYQPSSSDWGGLSQELGFSSTVADTTTTETSSWNTILCSMLDAIGQVFNFLSLPWKITYNLLSQVSSWLQAGTDYVFSLLGSISDLPSPIDILVGFSIAIALLYATLNVGEYIMRAVWVGIQAASAAPKLVIAMIIALAISGIAGALGISISQQFTACDFTFGVQTSSTTVTTGTTLGGGDAGGGGDTGW